MNDEKKGDLRPPCRHATMRPMISDRGAQCGAKFASNEALKSVSYPIQAGSICSFPDSGSEVPADFELFGDRFMIFVAKRPCIE